MEEKEHRESVTVDFTGCRQADGTYIHNSPEGILCPLCNRLLTAHSAAEAHECAIKDHQGRK